MEDTCRLIICTWQVPPSATYTHIHMRVFVCLLCHWAWHTFHLGRSKTDPPTHNPYFYFALPPSFASLSFAALVMHIFLPFSHCRRSSCLLSFSVSSSDLSSCDISRNMSGCYFYLPSFKSAISSRHQRDAIPRGWDGHAVCKHFIARLKAHCNEFIIIFSSQSTTSFHFSHKTNKKPTIIINAFPLIIPPSLVPHPLPLPVPTSISIL